MNIVLNMLSVTLCNLRNQLLNPQLCTVNKQSPTVSLVQLAFCNVGITVTSHITLHFVKIN